MSADTSKTDCTILQDQGSTNSYLLVVQDDQMTIYANGKRLRTHYDKRLTEGTPAFFAGLESGETTCTFNNGWLWVLDEK